MPYDSPRYVARFLDHWRPSLALFIEPDLWPNLIVERGAARVPMVLINGRMSDRSFPRWRRVSSTIADAARPLRRVSGAVRRRRRALCRARRPRVVTSGNLKLDVPAPPADPVQAWSVLMAIAGRPVIVAASTHPGEEAAIIEAHSRLRGNFPALLTLIVPRHPERGVGIARDRRRRGAEDRRCARCEELPDAGTDIYVADTMGELGLIYRLAPIVFMGGSLVPHGGQNPIEAAKLGAAIFHGPHVWKFHRNL